MKKFNKDFKRWWLKNHKYWSWKSGYTDNGFDLLTSSMKWGVYEDFFDSVDYNLEIHGDKNKKQYVWYVMFPHHITDDATVSFDIICNSRQEARDGALEKAIEIYNTKDKFKYEQ